MGLPITILTSIFPDRIDQQQYAVDSWSNLGFRVISVNNDDEIQSVAGFFPDVEFIQVHRCANKRVGSRIYLKEIFSSIQTLPGEIFGIVNSDIFFKAGFDFVDFLRCHATKSMVFGSRFDVAAIESEKKDEYSLGFDFFFFDRDILELYGESVFCLGKPVWDYWFPLIAMINGKVVKRIISPVAFHVIHENSWQLSEISYFWGKMIEEVFAKVKEKQVMNNYSGKIPLGELYFIKFDGELVNKILRHKSESLFYLANCPESSQIIGVEIYNELKKEIIESQLTISAVRKSKSWRYTKPFRYLLKRITKLIHSN